MNYILLYIRLTFGFQVLQNNTSFIKKITCQSNIWAPLTVSSNYKLEDYVYLVILKV